MIKSEYEQIVFNGDTIIELTHEYISGTITCTQLLNTVKKNIAIKELGAKFISIEDISTIPLNTVLNFNYSIKEEFSRLNEFERIKVLEKKVEDQEKILKDVLTALRYRVDIQTFTTWIKSVEKQIGIDIIAQEFDSGTP